MSAQPRSPKVYWKDSILAVLVVLVVVLGAVVARDHLKGSSLLSRGQATKVFDVALDRDNLKFFEIVFDRPIAPGAANQILGRAPATIDPPLGGVWKWRQPHILRFEASDKLAMATEYTVSLIPERFLPPELRLESTEVKVRTDQFVIEKADLAEEPADKPRTVILRGEIRFNYPVDPEVLAGKVHLEDPAQSAPLDVEIETGYENQSIVVRSAPVEKRKEERKLVLVVDGTVTPAHGNVALGADWRHEILLGSSEKLAVRSATAEPAIPESTLRLALSSPVDPALAARFVTVEPKAKFRLQADGNDLALVGSFAPGESYTIRLAAGLPATDGARLQQAWETKLDVPDLEPSIAFQSEGMFLSAQGPHAFALESVNVDSATVSVDRVYLNNLFALLQFQSWEWESDSYWGGSVSGALGDNLTEETIAIADKANQKVVTRVDLDPWIKDSEPGLYRVGVRRDDGGQGTQRWMLLTDLGVVAKRGGGELRVWVWSFRDLAAVGNARVRVVSTQNQILAEGRTDGDGAFTARNLSQDSDDPQPFYVTVEQGNDFSFLLLDRSRIDTSGFDVGGAQRSTAGYSAFLYGERDLYRPGETVHGVGVVRDENLHPPAPMPLVLRHRDPQGQERGDQRVQVDARGIAQLQLALPAYTLTGIHTLELLAGDEVIGSWAVHVEEFVPDRIKVQITPAADSVAPGGKLEYTVQSNYLFGPPGAGLPVETRVRLVASPFAPPGFEGYSFADPDIKFEDREIFSNDGTLDEQGKAPYEVGIPAGLRAPAGVEAVVTARVQEQGGRGVSALTRVRVHPYPFYLGIRSLGEAWVQPGNPAKFAWAAVTPDGKPAKAGGLRAELYRDVWHTVLRRQPTGAYGYESTRDSSLVSSQVIAPGQAAGEFTFTAQKFGSYRVVLSDPDGGASTSQELYVSGWGYSPWAMKSPAKIDLALERDEMAPGETAKLAVKAPFSGKLLVSVERDRVLWTQVVQLTGNTAEIAIPVDGAWRPNVYVTAILVRGVGELEPGGVGRAYGAIPLSVDRGRNRIPVGITAPEEMRPRRPVHLEIAAKPGALVTVSAVDEGILQLIAQKTPDPFAYFYAKLALGTESYDLFSQLLPDLKAKTPAGGGEDLGGNAQFLRTEGIRRVTPVSLWSGVVEAGSDGRAVLDMPVPDFQGALRVMAVALDDDQFGSAEKFVRVRDPLVLLPTFPRFLSLGETLEVPVSVRNDTGRPARVVVKLAISGAAKANGPLEQTVDVPNGTERAIRFSVGTANAPGVVQMKLVADANGEHAEASVGLDVRPDLPAITQEKVGSIEQATADLGADDTQGLRPENLRRELRLSPVPVVRLTGKLEYLLRYPYGCVEQTVSSAFPLIYLGDLAKVLEPDLFKKGDPSAMVQEALRRLRTMQLGSGGFSLWPGEEEPQPWASIYATHFVVEAKRAGYPVEGFLHDGALDYVAGELSTEQEMTVSTVQRAAYAAYVLARAGRADLGGMDFLRARQADKLGSDARALLAAAYAGLGNRKAVDELLRGLGEIEQVQRQTGENFDSAVRRRALVLLALEDAAPSDPRIAKLADQLMREATASQWTTQEASFALLAVGQLFKTQAAKAPYSGRVLVDGRQVATFDNKTVRLVLPSNGAVQVAMNPGYTANAAFYSLTSRGTPTDAAFHPVSAGLEVKRTFYDREGKEIDLANVKQGDLVVVKAEVRSTAGPVQNVVVENLLPSGLEVENARLATSETLPWAEPNLDAAYVDVRDDRVLLFVDLPAEQWQTTYAVLRAVTPGKFRMPPLQAEAMYDPSQRATGDRGEITVGAR